MKLWKLIVLFVTLVSFVSAQAQKEIILNVIRSDTKEVLGVLTATQFKTLNLTSKEYLEILKAESEGRLKITTDDTWEIYGKAPFEANILIEWRAGDGKPIKSIQAKLVLKDIKVTEESWLSRTYTKIARASFVPLLIIVTVLIVIPK